MFIILKRRVIVRYSKPNIKKSVMGIMVGNASLELIAGVNEHQWDCMDIYEERVREVAEIEYELNHKLCLRGQDGTFTVLRGAAGHGDNEKSPGTWRPSPRWKSPTVFVCLFYCP